METSPTFPSASFASRSAMSSSPASVTRQMRSSTPCASRSICQGTRLAWCSISLTSTACPGFSTPRPKEWATRLMAWVEPVPVSTISRSSAAFRKRAAARRAAS